MNLYGIVFTYLSCEAERIPRAGIGAKHLTVSACDIELGQVLKKQYESRLYKKYSALRPQQGNVGFIRLAYVFNI
jgi:hypothetical protein